MENYAGYMAFADHEIGRLLDVIRSLPNADNTLIVYIVGDNGASSEGGPSGTINEVSSLSGIQSTVQETLEHIDEIGGPTSEPHYPLGWAWAGNAPFQWVKQVASHLGGTRNPMVVSWPSRIPRGGGMRSQFTHIIDVVPTLLDVIGIPAPTQVNGIDQKPMDGVPITATFLGPDAHPVRDRQYFEAFSNRAIYDAGWIACAQHTLPWRQDYAPGNWEQDRWELYNLDEDFSEDNDVAAQHPDKVEELKALFDQEAATYGVFPLDDRGTARLLVPKPSPGDPHRTDFTYYPGAVRLAETAAPNTKNRSHRIDVSITEPGDGVLLAFGGTSAGFVLYVKDGRPTYHYNWFNRERTTITADTPIPEGASTVTFEFHYDGGGPGKGGEAILSIDGQEVGRGRLEQTVAARFGLDTMDVGMDTGAPVAESYRSPFAYTGVIDHVDIHLNPPGVDPNEERALHAMFDAGKEY